MTDNTPESLTEIITRSKRSAEIAKAGGAAASAELAALKARAAVAKLEDKLYSFDAEIESNTIEVLVSRLRKKLGPRPDGGERIKAVRGEGYIYLLPSRPVE